MILVILSVEEIRRKKIKEETIVNDDCLQKLVLVPYPQFKGLLVQIV